MDMRNMQNIMKQMKTEEIKVAEVLFNFPDGRQWSLQKPQVIKMDVMGQTTFQVIGKPVEKCFYQHLCRPTGWLIIG